jgi:hypothetical protein
MNYNNYIFQSAGYPAILSILYPASQNRYPELKSFSESLVDYSRLKSTKGIRPDIRRIPNFKTVNI